MRYKVTTTASGCMITFTDWEIYRRLYNANSGIVLILSSMNAA